MLQHKRLVRAIQGSLAALIAALFVWQCNHPFHLSSPLDNEILPPLIVASIALKHAQHLQHAPITTLIKPKQDWLEEPHVSYGYPTRDVWSSEQMCPDDEDFNMWIRKRTMRWHRPGYLKEKGIWQADIGDKVGGYLFARMMGVRAPRIDFCTGDGPEALSEYVPPKGKGFVVKDLRGHSSKNVFVMEHGLIPAGSELTGTFSLLDCFMDEVSRRSWHWSFLCNRSWPHCDALSLLSCRKRILECVFYLSIK